jgi:hypothetical protein
VPRVGEKQKLARETKMKRRIGDEAVVQKYRKRNYKRVQREQKKRDLA